MAVAVTPTRNSLAVLNDSVAPLDANQVEQLRSVEGLPMPCIGANVKVREITLGFPVIQFQFATGVDEWFKKHVIEKNFPGSTFTDLSTRFLISVPKGRSAEELVTALTNRANYRAGFSLPTGQLEQLNSKEGLKLSAIDATAKLQSFTSEFFTIHLTFEDVACNWFKRNVIKKNFPGCIFTELDTIIFVSVPRSESGNPLEEIVSALTNKGNYKSDFPSARPKAPMHWLRSLEHLEPKVPG